MGSELLPCPFCGDAAQVEMADDGVEDIACLNVYCLVQPRALGASTRPARDTWNTRAPATAVSNKWQPIETAPKDGTRILLWWPYWSERPFAASWIQGLWRAEEILDDEGDRPLAWMPLPSPPTKSITDSD